MKHLKHALIAFGLALQAGTALAADPPREVKNEFRQHVVKRDRLFRELGTIDRQAADAVAAGKKPMELHAKQIELQDKIDLHQLKLETLSIRWNLPIPAPPSPESTATDESTAVAQRVEMAFQDGRNRTDRVLNDRCRKMLGAIDYDALLTRGE
jgi:hypothetical protein